MKWFLLFLSLSFAGVTSSQQYLVTTSQTDEFSQALVKLMNCAPRQFTECKGDSIRTTWLMGSDYKSTITLPGSKLGIVRIRDWDKNVYVEFGSFDTERDLEKGIHELTQKIRTALGDQLFFETDDKPASLKRSASFALRDKAGYFSPAIELLPGSSAADPYLLGPEREVESGRKRFFVLLKVLGSIPTYKYFIRPDIVAPDKKLHALIKRLLGDAKTDFNSYPRKTKPSGKPRKIDTMQIDDHTVILNRSGANYSANIIFETPLDSVQYNQQWEFLHQAISAAVGKGYVYRIFSLGENDTRILYVSGTYDREDAVIYLEKTNNQSADNILLQIKIQSRETHPLKRGLTLDDFD